MKRRNNVDIMADVLRVTSGGAKKTWIVYKANLNFKILKIYISELMEKGMLEVFPDSTMYKTTEKGLEFLEQYDSFRKFHNMASTRERERRSLWD